MVTVRLSYNESDLGYLFLDVCDLFSLCIRHDFLFRNQYISHKM